MELINSTTEARDPYYLFEDWFALLNRGFPIRAVGTSDSHTVGDPVGQGRTYVRSSTDVPSQIDVDEACAAFRRGDTTISYGIYVELTVGGRYHPGQRVPVDERGIDLALRVAAPSWVRPRTVRVYRNGRAILESELEAEPGKPFDRTLDLGIPPPTQDAHLVCVVVGDPIAGPFWPQLNRYTLAATNPVFLDANRDGRYDSPAAQADAILRQHGEDPTALQRELTNADPSIGLQLLDGYARRLRKTAPDPKPAVPEALAALVAAVADRAAPVYREYVEALRSRGAAHEAKARREAMTRELRRRR